MAHESELGDGGSGGIDRRRFIRRTAIVGGAAWAAPALLTVNRASAADLTSSPPTTPTTAEVLPTEITRPTTGVGGGAGPVGNGGNGGGTQVLGTTAARGGSLPRTGTDVDTLLAGGVAAVAGGAALRLWSADRRLAAEGPTEATTTEPPAEA